MAGPVPVHRPRRWLIGCGIAAAAIVVVLALLVVGSLLFTKGQSKGGMPEAPREAMTAPSAIPAGSRMAGDEAPAGAPGEVREGGGGQPLFAGTAEAAESREIIYTGEMTVEVDDVVKSAKIVEELIKSSKGFLGSRTSNTDAQGNTSTTISMRVPAARFDGVVEQLRTLGEVRVRASTPRT